jgi:molybdopterin-containing oxidoreductase family iron-sulfur binding subunit
LSDRPDVDVDAIARRSFLKRMAAALALAGGGCSRAPSGRIYPYVAQPPEVQPGNPRHYASALALDGYAQGVLVASREGRPVKIEGNPEHPASLGAAGPFEQSAVLSLYDPDRARAVQHRRAPSTWHAAVRAIASGAWRERRGRGLSIVLEPTGSIVVSDLLARLRSVFPEVDVRWSCAALRTPVWEASRAAFGRVLEPRYRFDRADVIVVLDDDPLARGPAWLRWARHFADRRRSPMRDGMSRLYVIEPRLTPTGASADHRLAVRRSEVAMIAAALLAEVHGTKRPALAPEHARFVHAVARDLLAHRGRALVIAGDAQPAAVHVISHAIDAALGDIGTTKTFGASPILEAGEPTHDLAGALDAVDSLVVVGANIAYATPADLRLRERIAHAKESLYVGEHDDETARACTWSAPLAHALETWGDARAFDGTRSIVQPLVAPLYGGRTPAQVLAALLGEPDLDPHGLTRRSMRAVLDAPFEASWERALVHGVVDGSATPDVDLSFRWRAVDEALASLRQPAALELSFDLDRRVHDGRFTNIAWLAELPEPLTTLSWSNALLVSATTAARLGLADEDVAVVTARDRSLEVPVLVAAGHADDQLTLTLGWGRDRSLSVAGGHGANAYALRTSDAPWSVPVSIASAHRKQPLAIVQREKSFHARADRIAPSGTLSELRANGRIGRAPDAHPPALYANRPSAPHQWGMVVDLAACTGCSACVVACQAENNVPTVGFANMRKGREMLWLEIAVYHEGESTTRQPMLCQHCEQAPCEYVCPVGATTHSPDGLNEMTYNRCVGTRFCSNNCPYKVRRFNWFAPPEDDLSSRAHNPDVTVRARGVMEKCTYCVQRIRRGEIRAEVEHRELRDGDVVTACQQACPTRAIVFGDIADANSYVARLRADDTRLFAVLDELGTIPRTRYLARVTNPNPELG